MTECSAIYMQDPGGGFASDVVIVETHVLGKGEYNGLLGNLQGRSQGCIRGRISPGGRYVAKLWLCSSYSSWTKKMSKKSMNLDCFA